jgi:hypothetical protein
LDISSIKNIDETFDDNNEQKFIIAIIDKAEKENTQSQASKVNHFCSSLVGKDFKLRID